MLAGRGMLFPDAWAFGEQPEDEPVEPEGVVPLEVLAEDEPEEDSWT